MGLPRLVLKCKLIVIVGLLCVTHAQGDFIYYTSNSEFSSAVTLAALNSLGTENFDGTAGSTMDGSLKSITDPLTQGVSNTNFANGVSIPATFQSNVGDPDTINPRGATGMAHYNDIGGSWLYIGNIGDSMDIIPLESTTAICWTQRNFVTSATMTVRIYGQGDTLTATHTFAAVPQNNPPYMTDAFLGIETTRGEKISRVNVILDAADRFGIDTVSMYARANKYIENQIAFGVAVAGLNCLGTEDFEASDLTGPSALAFNDSLVQGVANGPFPTGATLPVKYQSNDSDNPDIISPRGTWGLALAEAGFAGLVSDGLLANYATDGLDLIMEGSDEISAVSFNPIGYTEDEYVNVYFYDTAGANAS